MCPDQELNQEPFGAQKDAQSLSHTGRTVRLTFEETAEQFQNIFSEERKSGRVAASRARSIPLSSLPCLRLFMASLSFCLCVLILVSQQVQLIQNEIVYH